MVEIMKLRFETEWGSQKGFSAGMVIFGSALSMVSKRFLWQYLIESENLTVFIQPNHNPI